MWGLLVPTSMSLFTLPVSLDTYKNLTPGFLLLSNYLLLSPDPFLLLPVTPPPPSRHDWDDQRNLHLAPGTVLGAPKEKRFFETFQNPWSEYGDLCVCLIGKQKKPILYQVTEPPSVTL